jgi:hypothetical protein
MNSTKDDLIKNNSIRSRLPRYSRLKGTLTAYSVELDSRIKSTGSENATWAIQARDLLDKTETFLKAYKIDEAWKCFHTAQRQEIYGTSANERIELSKILVTESSKLNEWRSVAIKEILKSKTIPSSDALVQATKLKDEHYNNIYYQNRLTRSLYSELFVLLAIVILLLIWFSNYYDLGSSQLPGHTEMLKGVILFGFLGAIISSILFTRNQAVNSSITEISTNTFIVLSKIAVGVVLQFSSIFFLDQVLLNQ